MARRKKRGPVSELKQCFYLISNDYRVLHDLVSPFIRRGYHVVLFNSRGVGQSSKWPSLSAMAEVEDLRQLVKAIVQQFTEEAGLAVERVVVLVCLIVL
jgi:alpha-beta hydrolase superfamily lysophospholipase